MKRLSLALLMGFVSSFAFAVTPSNGTLQRMIEQAIAARQQLVKAPKAPDWEVFCGDPDAGYASSGLAIRLSVPVVLVPDLYPWTAVGSARLAGEICDLVWDAVDRR